MILQGDLLPVPLTAQAVRSYINFDGGSGIELDCSTQAELQSKGVAAVWHLLQTKGYAYLADEVGMGKTRQAMGAIATQFLSDPASHVVIICPGKTLQEQWAREWDTFIRTCYKGLDNRLVSAVDGRALQAPHRHERLSDFAKSLLLNESRIHLLRYSSFSRPIGFGVANKEDTPDAVLAQYADSLREIGVGQVDDTARQFAVLAASAPEGWRATLTGQLNECYARHIGTLLKHRNIDLLALDEAQYLRHTDNRQNTNLAHVFRRHVPKWLFLSATPLHSGENDIKSLDTYLCRQPDGYGDVAACSDCSYRPNCTQATHRMRPTSANKIDVVELLAEFMVRRPRSFKDGVQRPHGKISYRRYRRNAISAAADPFLALTMALVQKHLVQALNGHGNKFRQGECASFESLSTSVRNMRKDRDGNIVSSNEIDALQQTGTKPPAETVDRGIIDGLNASFRSAMLPPAKFGANADPRYNLPHAKLTEVADSLMRNSLSGGVLHKTLVFARRLDTVDELVLLLLSRFQGEVDRRIAVWRDYLVDTSAGITLREQLWSEGGFWSSRSQDDDDVLHGDAEVATEDDGGDQELLERAADLPYFGALKRASGKQSKHGMLVSFHSRLLAAPAQQGPFAGFLLQRPEADAEAPADTPLWDAAQSDWERLLAVLTAPGKAAPEQRWLLERRPTGEAAWKLATIKRCLLQTLRQGDFIVDLYILNRFVAAMPGEPAGTALAGKLLWLMEQAQRGILPAPLRIFVANWIARMSLWIEHFNLVVDKCLRKDGVTTWGAIYGRVDGSFARMAPVMGRSGKRTERNAVTQFNFPTHPSVLVCTDVLKEGVDMHLFCDEIVHYGVAWTSGDLEQRIGRIDRFGSQISRRIAAHNDPDHAALPRLGVEFPYLEGTLDRHQVERVMLAKVRSDLRMDLGRHEKDLGTIAIGSLDNPADDGGAAQQGLDQYPSGTLEKLSGPIVAPGRFATTVSGSVEEAVHAPELGVLVVRPTWTGASHALLRQVPSRATARKTILRTEEEYLQPDSEAGTRPALIPLAEALHRGMPLAVQTLPYSTSFHFSPLWNTFAREILISNPFAPVEERVQTVLLERLGDYILLRTPIARVDNADAQPSRKDWEGIIPWHNVKRRWGFLVIEEDTVWFICFVLASAPGGLLDTLSERVGKIGDRLQHLHLRGSDEAVIHYRSRLSCSSIAAAHAAHFRNKHITFMTTDQDDLRAHGRLLAEGAQWFSSAFATVLDTLYGNNTYERGLEILPITLLSSGVLHISATGKERFTLNAYLDLTPESSIDGRTIEPRMVWQVAASASARGPKPQLPLWDWDDLPHAAPENWEGESKPGCAVYHYKDDNRRYLVLYHAPAMWDGTRTELLQAWAGLLERMNGEKFQKQAARLSFLKTI